MNPNNIKNGLDELALEFSSSDNKKLDIKKCEILINKLKIAALTTKDDLNNNKKLYLNKIFEYSCLLAIKKI